MPRICREELFKKNNQTRKSNFILEIIYCTLRIRDAKKTKDLI